MKNIICKLIGHDFNYQYKEYLFCIKCGASLNMEKAIQSYDNPPLTKEELIEFSKSIRK